MCLEITGGKTIQTKYNFVITIKLNDKPISIPTSWPEVTFSQWLQIMKMQEGIFNILAIFTCIPADMLSKMTIIGADKIVSALSFTSTKPTMPGYVDKVGTYKLPSNHEGKFNIQYESLGQFEDARMIYKSMEGDKIVDGYGKLVAIYLQKLRDGVYDANKVPDLELEIQSFPAIEVITAGSFFFLKLVSLSSGIPIVSLHTPPSQKKSKQASKTTSKRLASTRKSTRYRGR